MANSADPDQMASSKAKNLDLDCLQTQSISGYSRTRVNQTVDVKTVQVMLGINCWINDKQCCP